jgi:hypothetical protein
MTAVNTILQDAMYEAQILGAGETMSSEDSAYALRILNRLIGSWANENLLCYATTEETFNTVPNQIAYSTSLLSSRPVTIQSIFLRKESIDYSIKLIGEQKYNEISLKTTAGIPSACYYDPTYPNGTLKFFLAPDSVYEAHVFSVKPLTGTLDPDAQIDLPAGYEQMVVTCLAKELCRPFNMPISKDLQEAAREAKAWLKRTNYQPLEMSSVLDMNADMSTTFIYKGF